MLCCGVVHREGVETTTLTLFAEEGDCEVQPFGLAELDPLVLVDLESEEPILFLVTKVAMYRTEVADQLNRIVIHLDLLCSVTYSRDCDLCQPGCDASRWRSPLCRDQDQSRPTCDYPVADG